MSSRTVFSAIVVAVASLFGLGAAHAGEPIEVSGNVYHQAVCSRAIRDGEARCHAHIRVDASGHPFEGRPNAAVPNLTPSGYSALALQKAYYGATSPTGSSTVAIVDAYGYPNAESDLAVYRSTMGLTACTTANGCFTKVGQDGTGSYSGYSYSAGWAQEQALDLAMVSAMCPNCKILLVEASSSNFANLGTAVRTAQNLGARVISNSYGGTERGSANINNTYYAPASTTAVLTVSAGDSGYGVAFPATSPDVVTVGGTSLYVSSGAWSSETTWSGTGSGCSKVYAKPGNETDLLCTMRMETDVSAVGDPSTGVAVYGPTGSGTASGWLVFGGTSVGAPLIGGIYGNQADVTTSSHAAANNAQAKLWAAPAGSLHDVTIGNNGRSCGGSYFCTAGAGYDGPTGNGTPNGAAAF